MSFVLPELKEQCAHRRCRIAGILLLLAHCALLGCASKVRVDEQTPLIKYDDQGRIKGLFGLRTEPSGDPTCRLRENTVDFVNIEREEYLVFQLPSTFRVWVKIEGEMRKILTDPQNSNASEFLSRGKKYKLMAYACDGIGHTSYETVSVELLD